jgi:dolichol-phosphate mannosyltransferase
MQYRFAPGSKQMTSPFKKVLPVDADEAKAKIAAVIPCFRVRKYILKVLEGIGNEISAIYVIDDHCPENTGDYVASSCKDPRVVVVRHQKNLGVGGAIITGYQHAYSDGAIIAVKIDGDGQMDPSYIPDLINPLLSGESDYTKGNRFGGVQYLREMPLLRVFGNSLLSFFSKLSSGYWNILDPTNGFTAIHLSVLSMLPLERISKKYFFESDLLYHLNIVDAVVTDIPIPARYRGERSSLRIYKVVPEFLIKHLYNFFRRLVVKYFILNISIASLELFLGILFFISGLAFGLYHWTEALIANDFVSSGRVMLAALPMIIGTQFLIAFLSHDYQSIPKIPIHRNTGK